MTDIRQSISYANYLESQGWIVERIKNTNYFIKNLPILGSILKIQRPNKLDINSISKTDHSVINQLISKYKVFQTIIEPKGEDDLSWLVANGYRQTAPFLPSKTIHLDLTQNKDQIFRNFSKDCRYSIKRGESIVIKECSTNNEITLFHNAWKKSVNFNRYIPSLNSLLSLKKSFPQNHSLFVTSHNKVGRIIGGAIFTTSSHDASNYITYYWYGFTNKEGRTSLSQYSLLYYGILWAKKQGYKVFDFEGIYDDRFPLKSWQGFTHFKKQFGGIEILYPGCFTKFRIPFL